jgi:SAM-dependent methyltransferase
MRMQKRSTAEFDQYAASYAELLEDPVRNRFAGDPLHFHRRKRVAIRDMLRRAGVDASGLVWLDVGCGRGELLELMGGDFAEAFGCDPATEMIQASIKAQVTLQKSPIELPFETSSIDFVTAVCVLHHVDRSARMLWMRELRRVLTPGGLCCLVEHNPWNPVTRAIVRRCPMDVNADIHTAAQTSALLRVAGFDRIRTDYFLYLPEKLFRRFGPAELIFRKVPLGGQYAILARAAACATPDHDNRDPVAELTGIINVR